MKKYWSHILNIVYIVFVDCFVGMCAFGINSEEMMSGVPTAILPIGFIIILIMTFAILGEMIYAIVKAAQDTNLDNKALHIIGLYFFNVFYIPCYRYLLNKKRLVHCLEMIFVWPMENILIMSQV